MSFKSELNKLKDHMRRTRNMVKTDFENLHIMHNDKFNAPLVDFFNRYFEADKHLFIFYKGYGEELFKIPDYWNVIKIKENRQPVHRR